MCPEYAIATTPYLKDSLYQGIYLQQQLHSSF